MRTKFILPYVVWELTLPRNQSLDHLQKRGRRKKPCGDHEQSYHFIKRGGNQAEGPWKAAPLLNFKDRMDADNLAIRGIIVNFAANQHWFFWLFFPQKNNQMSEWRRQHHVVLSCPEWIKMFLQKKMKKIQVISLFSYCNSAYLSLHFHAAETRGAGTIPVGQKPRWPHTWHLPPQLPSLHLSLITIPPIQEEKQTELPRLEPCLWCSWQRDRAPDFLHTSCQSPSRLWILTLPCLFMGCSCWIHWQLLNYLTPMCYFDPFPTK